MRTWLVAAAILWPALLSAATLERIRGEAPAFTTTIYLIASRVCHQRPERSFQSRTVTWPVCARCTGLYFSAPIGALVALLGMRRRAIPSPRRITQVLALTALPTLATLAIEWSGALAVTSVWRALAALPLGAAAAWAVTAVASGPSEPIR